MKQPNISIFLIFFIVGSLQKSEIYQVRQVYYQEGDSICAYEESDHVKTIFTFDQQEKVEKFASAGLFCQSWAVSEFWRIQTLTLFVLTIEQDIYFDVELLRVNPYGVKKEIYSNTTLQTKKIHFKGNDYDCQLRGDGTVQHYNKKNSPITSIFNVDCKRKYLK